jgi:undecaprenyl diphosphate synthase
MTLIDLQNIPRHVAITMDGNGRWAELRGKPRVAGHRAGSHAVRRIVRAARRLGLRELTLYAFSEQNWGRPQGEVDALMILLQDFLVSEREEILQNTIRLRAIGDVSRLPDHVRDALETTAEASRDNDAMVLTLALSYGGQEEIADAVRDIAEAVRRGELRPEDIGVEAINKRIPSVRHGAPDLMVRTGGEQRISNFLLWGSAYSELFFSDTLWPDFEAEDLYGAIAAYQRRQRRFGLVPTKSALPTNGNGLHPCRTSPTGS